MRILKGYQILICTVFLLMPQIVAGQSSHAELAVDDNEFALVAEYYQYDQDLALEPEVFGEWPWRGPHTIFKVSYRSTHALRVLAYLAIPKTIKYGERRPAVLLMHGWNLFWGKNEDWVQAMLPELTSAGFVVLAPDHFLFGERKPSDGGLDKISECGPYYMRDWMTQTVVDLRRGIDYLQTRPEVDPNRIAILGGSLGGWIGSLLSALEPRIKASVLTVPGSEFVQKQGPGWRIINASNFYSRIQTPLLVVNALQDNSVRIARSRELFERVPGTKKLIEYDEGHYLDPAKYSDDIIEWLKENN